MGWMGWMGCKRKNSRNCRGVMIHTFLMKRAYDFSKKHPIRKKDGHLMKVWQFKVIGQKTASWIYLDDTVDGRNAANHLMHKTL